MKSCSFLTSKNKGLIPFRMIEKYKYIFFVTVSVVGGGLSWFLRRLVNEEPIVLDDSIFLSFWIWCIASFCLYSIAETNTKIHNNKLQ